MTDPKIPRQAESNRSEDAMPSRDLTENMEVEVEIEKLIAGGDGLARYDGLPIFVPRAAPGDQLQVKIVSRRPSYARGEIQQVLVPGASRREPPCPHFGHCGGCDLQHIEDESQAEFKAEAALETLRRLGGLDLQGVETEVIVGESWSYRLRTQLRTARLEDGVELGYFARGSQNVVPVKSCPVLVPALEKVIREPFPLGAVGAVVGE